jgi:hypothetical protein
MKELDGLMPVNTPLEHDEIRRLMMSFVIVPARLKKLKRLVDKLYSNGRNNV